MLKETNQEKVKVLEVKGVKFEGEYFLVPTKIEISGQTYQAEVLDDFPLGEVSVELEQLRGVRLKEIPDSIHIYCDVPQLLGELKVSKGTASLEIWRSPKLYRGFIPINSYFDVIKKIASKMGLEILNEERDDNMYRLELTKFSEEVTVAEVCESFEELSVKIRDAGHLVEEFTESVLKSIDSSEATPR